MGYTTEFEGQLTFTKPLMAEQLAYLNTFLGENGRDHPEWVGPNLSKEISYIQFELTKDFTGIQWDGSEKFYFAVEAVNLILVNMQAKYPDFGLYGSLTAQGEEIDDRWQLAIVDGKAIRKDVPIIGQKVTCPHCNRDFVLE